MCDCNPIECQQIVWRKARKQHKCCECNNTINIGDVYEYISGIYERKGCSFKTCSTCSDVRHAFVDSIGPYDQCWPVFGDLWSEALSTGESLESWLEWAGHKDAVSKYQSLM